MSWASTSCPRHRASGLGMSADFVAWPRAYVYFKTKSKPMICIRQYVAKCKSCKQFFTGKKEEYLDYAFLYVAYMRVMTVSCSYLLYEYLLKRNKYCPRSRDFVLGLVVLSSSSASGVWPRSTSLLLLHFM